MSPCESAEICLDGSTKSNVLISDEGHALISDFGYTHLDKSSFNLTVSPPCGGTLNWMAPEILDPTEQENVCSVGSDVWAFGMTILVRLDNRCDD